MTLRDERRALSQWLRSRGDQGRVEGGSTHERRTQNRAKLLESIHTQSRFHGGKRNGAGRKHEGRERFNVCLTPSTIASARELTPNVSALLDALLAQWVIRQRRVAGRAQRTVHAR